MFTSLLWQRNKKKIAEKLHQVEANEKRIHFI